MSKPLAVFFSDPHLNRVWSAHTIPTTRERLTEAYYLPVQELIAKYADKGVQLMCGGDWFDRAHNPEKVIQRSAALLKRVTVTVAGNHDHVNRDQAITSLALLGNLDEDLSYQLSINPDHLNETSVDLHHISDEVDLFTVPHHATQALFEAALFEAATAAKTTRATHHILMTHCNVGDPGGGKPDSNLYLTPALQQALGETFDYILVGHEHVPRRIGEKVIVMGSTQPCNFGELGCDRSAWELHLRDGDLTIERVSLATQLRSTRITLNSEADVQRQAGEIPDLVHLVGVMPVTASKQVQRLVKSLYERGALAVKLDINFTSGTVVDGEAVQGSMSNLLDVVRGEIQGNKDWTRIFNDTLAKINEEKA